MIEHNWKVQQVERAPIDGDLVDVVKVVHITCFSKDGTHQAAESLHVQLDPPDPDTMTPWADLTHDMVLGWCQGCIDEHKAEIEASNAAQIDRLKNPPIVTTFLPDYTPTPNT